MVMLRILMLILVPLFGFAKDVDVKAEINRYQLYEYYPINGSLIVTHPRDQVVDVQSATLDGAPLLLELEKEVQISPESPLLISIYRFTLQPQKMGDHTLNPISIKVGGDKYTTSSVTYSITKGTVVPDYEEPYLKLEAKVEANDPLFPGQRVKITYRFIFRGNIQLTKTILPLLKPKGFKIIGEERVHEYDEGDKSIQEFLLEVEAVKPGKFTFGTSSIEAQAVVPGKPLLNLQSEVPPVVIVVTPFPKGDQPITFEGAFGKFSIKDTLQSSPKVKVGDRLTVFVDISGDSKQLEKVELPNIFCQPGFSGMFTADTWPVTGKIEGDRKRFTVYLRPVHDFVKEIPAITMNYYNPVTGDYVKEKTESIPIEVEAVKNVLADDVKLKITVSEQDGDENWTELLRDVRPVQIKEATALSSKDLKNAPFGEWYVLLLIPLGTAGLIGQYFWKRKRYE